MAKQVNKSKTSDKLSKSQKQEIARAEADVTELKKQITDSLAGITVLARGLVGFNTALDQAGRLIIDLASDGKVLVKSLTNIVGDLKKSKITAAGQESASGGQGAASAAGNVAQAGASIAGGAGGSKKGIDIGDIFSGVGAGLSIVSGIFGIFRRRKEEEKKYRREMEQALNDQLSAEVALSIVTSKRLIDEQSITREKYKQIEAGLNRSSVSRRGVIADIDEDMEEMYRKLNGNYSSKYKRGVENYYKALLDLKNHKDDLEWLQTIGDNPLITRSDDSYDRYKSLYERLLKIAEQEKEWKDQQKQLADGVIDSSAQTLADSWVNAFKKGEEATWDFAKNFEDVMRQAIINGFSDSVIAAQIDPIFNKFRDKIMGYLSGDLGLEEVVTPDLEKEIEQTAEKIKKLSPELKNILEKLGLEVDNSGSETMSAAIKGVSEETASLVAGQMNAIRTNQLKSLDMFTESVASLGLIEANTRYNRYLESIDRRLSLLSTSGGSLRAAGLS